MYCIKDFFFFLASLSCATACSSSSDVSTYSHKSLSGPANVCADTVCSSNVYPTKPICLGKSMCLNNVRPSKLVISKKFYLSKPVCPRNINSNRSIR